MSYERATCYFLSGTGNSYRATEWLAQALRDGGTAVEVIPIDRAAPRQDLRPGASQLVGICHPTHGLMPPWSMIKFLIRMPLGRGAHAAVVATRGGIRIGPWVLPGATGLALIFPMFVLLLKGYRVRAGLGIDMPVNMINLHWGLKAHNVERIIAWGRRRHRRLVDALLAGRTYWHPLNALWETLWAVAVLWLYPLFPLAYLLVGRVFMAKLMFADTRCRGCGRCARFCPNGAIRMIGSKRKVPFWTHRCEVCMRCIGYCKPHAAQASHLWIAPVVLVTSLLTADTLEKAAGSLLGLELVVWDPARSLVALGLSFAALILLYYPFWGMQRLRPLHVMVSALTLTRYYRRRYHEPLTDVKQMCRAEAPTAEGPDDGP